LKKEKNLSDDWSDDYVIQQGKRANLIYEPKEGTFKIQTENSRP
jgi:hypothetical protein